MSSKISSLLLLSNLTGEEEIPVALNGNNFKVRTKSFKGATTKEEVGLGNVDNTADSNKPVSGPVAQALLTKAPMGHTHPMDAVTDLVMTLAGKAATVHTHQVADVEGLPQILSGKAAATHSHAIDSITDLPRILEEKSNVGHTHSKSNITGLNDDLISLQTQINFKAPMTHTHNPAEINGLDPHIIAVVTAAGIGDGKGDVEVGTLAW